MKQANKVCCKSSELISILEQQLSDKMNLARIKFTAMFICALCKVQTVCFEKLATAFQTRAKPASSLRRIQRFMAEYALDVELTARLIFKLLPHKPPYRLAMDRTNWKFGKTSINVLTLAIVYKGVAFPLLMTMLDKQGNSNTKERIDLINKYIKLFGKDTIDCLLADRELIGAHWIKYLNQRNIRYYIRIRQNFIVEHPGTEQTDKAFEMFANLTCGQTQFLPDVYRVNGQSCYLAASKVKNKQGASELQIIIAFDKPEQAIPTYKDRWQIETAFKALKSSGFHIEDTHVRHLNRIEKLFSMVMIAFTWAYVVGIFAHEHLKPIRILKHGRRAQSFFKHGLQIIAAT